MNNKETLEKVLSFFPETDEICLFLNKDIEPSDQKSLPSLMESIRDQAIEKFEKLDAVFIENNVPIRLSKGAQPSQELLHRNAWGVICSVFDGDDTTFWIKDMEAIHAALAVKS
jgi:hypothetical protein